MKGWGPMNTILKYANDFRDAIERAKRAGETDELNFFDRFPRGCCGDTSNLLAQYLCDNGIQTLYVSGTYYYGESTYDSQNHAWLLVDDDIIVDITGDQFRLSDEFYCYDQSVYVGFENEFYRLFEVDYNRDVHEYGETCLSTARLRRLYGIIMKYIKKSLDEKIANANDDSVRVLERDYPRSIKKKESELTK